MVVGLGAGAGFFRCRLRRYGSIQLKAPVDGMPPAVRLRAAGRAMVRNSPQLPQGEDNDAAGTELSEDILSLLPRPQNNSKAHQRPPRLSNGAWEFPSASSFLLGWKRPSPWLPKCLKGGFIRTNVGASPRHLALLTSST